MNFLLVILLLVSTTLAQQVKGGPGQNECQVINNNYYVGPGSEQTSAGPPNVHTRGSVQQGAPGKRGPRGEKGQKGAIGLKGNVGAAGSKGEIGIKGPKGDIGQTGEQGERGPLGNVSISLEDIQQIKNEIYKEIFPQSCAQISPTSSGLYSIYPRFPTSINEIEVYCEVVNGTVMTRLVRRIEHDSQNEIKVPITYGCGTTSPGCVQRKITYKATMAQIESVINASTHCRQFIKYRCQKTLLLRDDLGWWVGRTGVKQYYWGGATSRRHGYCACGEDGSCHDSAKKCNCDINSTPELVDAGYLDDMTQLPVMGLAFGDMDGDPSDESGYHTLGPLECW